MSMELMNCPCATDVELAVIEEDGMQFVEVGSGKKKAKVVLFEAPYNLGMVQPGMVENDESLAEHIAKLDVWIEGPLDANEKPTKEHLIFEKEMNLVLIGKRNVSRQKYPGPYKQGSNEKPVCFSEDGVRPSPYAESPMADVCSECPYSEWGEDRTPPECKDSAHVIFLWLEKNIPLYMRLSGRGISKWNSFIRQMEKQQEANEKIKRAKIMGLPTTSEEVPLDNMVINLTVKNKGTYSEPIFTLAEAPEGIVPDDIMPLCQHYSYKFITQYLDERMKKLEEAAAEKTGGTQAALEYEENVDLGSTDGLSEEEVVL